MRVFRFPLTNITDRISLSINDMHQRFLKRLPLKVRFRRLLNALTLRKATSFILLFFGVLFLVILIGYRDIAQEMFGEKALNLAPVEVESLEQTTMRLQLEKKIEQ